MDVNWDNFRRNLSRARDRDAGRAILTMLRKQEKQIESMHRKIETLEAQLSSVASASRVGELQLQCIRLEQRLNEFLR